MAIMCRILTALLLLGVSCADKVNVTVKATDYAAKTDEDFVCATLDWWPDTKCNYGQCPWGRAGILNLDLQNLILANAIKAFSPLRIRIGGSLQDQVVYQVGSQNDINCPKFELEKGGLFGFSNGCLPMDRWDELSQFFNQTGAKITFGLNALSGKMKDSNSTLWVGRWSFNNALDFITYNARKGYKVDSYELGNELAGVGVAARLPAEQYALDITVLKRLVYHVHQCYNPRVSCPMVLGPAGFYEEEWFNTFLSNTGPNVVDGITHHIYNLGSGADKDLLDKVQDPSFLSLVGVTLNAVSKSVDQFAPWAGAWVGEAGGAYNSGGKGVSNTFVDGFWYLDQMGMAAMFKHKVYCRQALIGGNYGLLNTTTFVPNPDYYSVLLWHRLMGPQVLLTTHNGSAYLHAYSHCSKTKDRITVLLINMSNSTTFEVSVVDDLDSKAKMGEEGLREEYHLSPEDGNTQSQVVLLNGTPLELTQSYDIPALDPQVVNGSLPITVMPDSIVFATLQGHQIPACNHN